MYDIPDGPYDIIVADPPWRFASNSDARPGRNARRHYPCMGIAEIKALPVLEIARKPCLLFLWATAPMLPHALQVMDAWSFKYVSNLTWKKERIGTGFWARNRHEHVLIGKRGAFPCPKPAPFSDSVIEGWQGRHSAKPEALQDTIDSQWPDKTKIELFARRSRPGWSVWGNEVVHV